MSYLFRNRLHDEGPIAPPNRLFNVPTDMYNYITTLSRTNTHEPMYNHFASGAYHPNYSLGAETRRMFPGGALYRLSDNPGYPGYPTQQRMKYAKMTAMAGLQAATIAGFGYSWRPTKGETNERPDSKKAQSLLPQLPVTRGAMDGWGQFVSDPPYGFTKVSLKGTVEGGSLDHQRAPDILAFRRTLSDDKVTYFNVTQYDDAMRQRRARVNLKDEL